MCRCRSYYHHEGLNFLRVSSRSRSCLLALRTGGLPVIPNRRLRIRTFVLRGRALVNSPITLLRYSNRGLSARLIVSKRHFPRGEALGRVSKFVVFSVARGQSRR